MTTFEIIIIAIGLAMDASAVSLAAAAAGFAKDARAKFRLSFHFGLFQFLMPVLGWFLGIRFVSHFKAFDHWIAFALLLYLGIKMIYSSSNGTPVPVVCNEIRVTEIITQSFATSIDALAVGLSLALLNVNIVLPVIIIGITTFLFSVAGLYIGNYSGKKFRRGSEMIGGILLILIGVKILIEHLSISH